MQLYRVKYLKCLRTRKYILEHRCEWNLSLVWLSLAIVAFYLNCLDRVVLARPFWALETFPVCFFLFLAVGQMEHLPWVQNGPVGFGGGETYVKSSICAEWWWFCVSGKIVTLYERELFKRILYPVSKRRVQIIPIVLCTGRVRIPEAVEEYEHFIAEGRVLWRHA